MKLLILFAVSLIYQATGEIDLQNIEIPEVDIDDFAAIKEKCDKEGGTGTYDKLKESKQSIQTCIPQFANFSTVNDEVEAAKKTGSMDEVFGKYCAKRTKLASCLEPFGNSLRNCLNQEEKKALNTTIDILKQLGDFACFRDGDRIAMFIAEGGVECIKSHTEGIKNCVNSTFKIQPSTANTNSLPNFLMDKKKCDDLGKLQICVVQELENCKDSTPANIVDALFKFIKRSACANKQKRSVKIHNIMKRSTEYANYLFQNASNLKSNFLSVFREKCAQNAPDGGYEAFTLTFESSTHCIRNKTRDQPIWTTPRINFKENIQRCVRRLIEKTSACLPEEEKYWPHFYLEAILNLVDFLYDNKNTLLNLSRVEIFNCIQNFKHETAKKEVTECFEVPQITNLKKEAVCRKITSMKTCLTEQVKKRCIPDVTITKLTENFFKAFTSPCIVNEIAI